MDTKPKCCIPPRLPSFRSITGNLTGWSKRVCRADQLHIYSLKHLGKRLDGIAGDYKLLDDGKSMSYYAIST